MKVCELVDLLKKASTIKKSKVMDIKKYYISMFRAYMIELYDRGYISDPTTYNEIELRKNIVDLGITHLTNIAGSIVLDEDYIGYCIAKYKDDEDKIEFLNILLNVIKYRNIWLNIDKFYDSSFSGDTKDSKKLTMGIVMTGSKIYSKKGFKIDEGIIKCFRGLDTEVDFVSLNSYIYFRALEVLDLDTRSSSESLFVKGLTIGEEIKYSHLILNGLVNLDGEYADILVNWLKKNKWSEGTRFSSQSEGLYNYILYIKSDDMLTTQARVLSELLDNNKEIVGARSDGFYVVNDGEYMPFPVGAFAILSDDYDGEQMPIINKLEGYTGEVYSLNFLIENDIPYVGAPIELYIDNKTKGLFVDKEQTDMKHAISWFSDLGASIEFEGSIYKSGVFKSGTVEDDLYRLVGDSESGIHVGNIRRSYIGKNLEKAKKVVVKEL